MSLSTDTGSLPVSFEFFPPKTPEGADKLAAAAGLKLDDFAQVSAYEFYGDFHRTVYAGELALRDMGMLLGEIWDLEELAADCAADGVYEFQLVATALPFTGALPDWKSRFG